MSEIVLNLEKDITLEELKTRFESITREYSLAVVESTDEGNCYPEAGSNLRFLNDFIFELECAIKGEEAYLSHEKSNA